MHFSSDGSMFLRDRHHFEQHGAARNAPGSISATGASFRYGLPTAPTDLPVWLAGSFIT